MPPAANSDRNFKSKAALEIASLLVPLGFRGSCQGMLQRLTNFGSGALVHATAFADEAPASKQNAITTGAGNAQNFIDDRKVCPRRPP